MFISSFRHKAGYTFTHVLTKKGSESGLVQWIMLQFVIAMAKRMGMPVLPIWKCLLPALKKHINKKDRQN